MPLGIRLPGAAKRTQPPFGGNPLVFEVDPSDRNNTVDGSEIPNNHLGCIKPLKNNGDIYHINWWTPDFWTIKRMPNVVKKMYHTWMVWVSGLLFVFQVKGTFPVVWSTTAPFFLSLNSWYRRMATGMAYDFWVSYPHFSSWKNTYKWIIYLDRLIVEWFWTGCVTM